MSSPRYPTYKASGVKWLGEVPEHWTVSRLKHLADICMGQSPPSEECNRDGIGVPFLQGCAEFGEQHPTANQFCEDANKTAQAGEILFSVRAPVGKINIADQTYGIGRGLCAIQARNSCDQRFLLYWLQVASNELDAVATGSTYQAVSTEQVANSCSLAPSLEEQSFIARFLDRETAKIDALIAEQQRLIELLQEKRQAVISRAVTKGLDPHAPMKGSGVEWLGEVPGHWKLRKFGWDFQAGMGQTILREDLEEDGIPVFSATEDDSVFGHLTNPTIQLEAGDLVIPARGNCIGAVKLMRSTATCTQTTIYCKPRNQSFKTEYVFAYLQAKRVYLFPMTRTAIPQITVKEVMSNLVPLPPLEEQEQIERCISDCRQTHDELIDFSQRAILLLQERRSALVSAAVTGQIDVRGLATEEEP